MEQSFSERVGAELTKARDYLNSSELLTNKASNAYHPLKVIEYAELVEALFWVRKTLLESLLEAANKIELLEFQVDGLEEKLASMEELVGR